MARGKTWKQIEQSRDTRLWITTVWLPIAGIVAGLYTMVPEVRYAINSIPYKVKQTTQSIKEKFKEYKEKKESKKES